jgi:hypothetical protein
MGERSLSEFIEATLTQIVSGIRAAQKAEEQRRQSGPLLGTTGHATSRS